MSCAPDRPTALFSAARGFGREVSGNTREHADLLKSLGGRWYGPKRVWSFYNADPTESLASKLPAPSVSAVPQIAGKPVAEMTDEALQSVAKSALASDATKQKANDELEARRRADQVMPNDAGSLARALRDVSTSERSADDDIVTSAARYVPFTTALKIAKDAIEASSSADQEQLRWMLDITADSAERLLMAVRNPSSLVYDVVKKDVNHGESAVSGAVGATGEPTRQRVD